MQSHDATCLRWGILGPGRIARKFAADVNSQPGSRLQAVASRDPERAERFADEFSASASYGSYEELVADAAVDVVYVATPHPFHADGCRLALEHGKAVLVEKPAVTHPDALEPLLRLAAERRLFFMEGMWTRFFPIMDWLRRTIQSGRIGEPRRVEADFGFRCDWDPGDRLLNPALAGGALLDVGIYPLAFCCDVLGETLQLQAAVGHVGETGVDEQSTLLLQTPTGAIGVASGSIRTQTRHLACVYGTEGRIELAEPFWRPRRAKLISQGGAEECIEDEWQHNGYQFQIQHVEQMIAQGKPESPLMSHGQSRQIQRIMWQARRQIGVRYPFDPSPPD